MLYNKKTAKKSEQETRQSIIRHQSLHRCSQRLGVKEGIFEKKYSRYFVHSQHSGMCCGCCEYSKYCTAGAASAGSMPFVGTATYCEHS